MKKIKFLIFLSILFSIISIILIWNHRLPKSDNIKEKLAFQNILQEVELASGITYDQVLYSDITKYIPVNFTDQKKYIYAINNGNNDEYFFVAKDLTYEEKIDLESMYEDIGEETFIFYSDDEYIYFINSEENLYMIDGIIQSFISNYIE